jgi:hypothetical protein
VGNLVSGPLAFLEGRLWLVRWTGGIGASAGGAQSRRCKQGEYQSVSLGTRHVSPFQDGGNARGRRAPANLGAHLCWF